MHPPPRAARRTRSQSPRWESQAAMTRLIILALVAICGCTTSSPDPPDTYTLAEIRCPPCLGEAMDLGIAQYRAEQNDEKLVVFAAGTAPDLDYEYCLAFTDSGAQAPTLRFSWKGGWMGVRVPPTRLFHTCAMIPARSRIGHVVVQDADGVHEVPVVRHR